MFFLADWVSVRRCQPPAGSSSPLPDSVRGGAGGGAGRGAECSSAALEKACAKAGGSCVTIVDAFYPLTGEHHTPATSAPCPLRCGLARRARSLALYEALSPFMMTMMMMVSSLCCGVSCTRRHSGGDGGWGDLDLPNEGLTEGGAEALAGVVARVRQASKGRLGWESLCCCWGMIRGIALTRWVGGHLYDRFACLPGSTAVGHCVLQLYTRHRPALRSMPASAAHRRQGLLTAGGCGQAYIVGGTTANCAGGIR